ncbi:LOW QUALITY PROTEIN: hypothetical protein ElyMa_001629300 [Elysia marginata]|uniref:Uncharacterized protein n=1 Tax=Elysia marginata TaxID=1093978 RepID=A0AAV4JPZ1_9GAST|nr:LOW QUALITY PROTEIN: hypothetical protein ElyMa_001629300 [Elysia marginata]
MDILIPPTRRKSSFLIRDILGDRKDIKETRSTEPASQNEASDCQEVDSNLGFSTPERLDPCKPQIEGLKTVSGIADFAERNSIDNPFVKVLDQDSRFFHTILKQRLLVQGQQRYVKDDFEDREFHNRDVNLKRQDYGFEHAQEFKGKLENKTAEDLFDHDRILNLKKLEKETYFLEEPKNDKQYQTQRNYLTKTNEYNDIRPNMEQALHQGLKTKIQRSDAGINGGDGLIPDFDDDYRVTNSAGNTKKHKNTTPFWSEDISVKDSMDVVDVSKTARVSPADYCTSTSLPQPSPTPSPASSSSPPSPLPSPATPSAHARFPMLFPIYNKDLPQKSDDRDPARQSKDQEAMMFASRSSLPPRPVPHHPQPLACLRPTTTSLPPIFPFRVTQHQGLHQPMTSSSRHHLPPGQGHPCLGFPPLSSAGFLSRGEFPFCSA